MIPGERLLGAVLAVEPGAEPLEVGRGFARVRVGPRVFGLTGRGSVLEIDLDAGVATAAARRLEAAVAPLLAAAAPGPGTEPPEGA